MAKKKLKWTWEIRMFLYKTLHKQFGPYQPDEMDNSEEMHKNTFVDCYEELAEYFSETTGKTFTITAIRAQVQWAITTQKTITMGLDPFIKNKAAAHEAGFINSDLYPISSHMEYKNKRKE